jgi:hypothetical protein
MNRIERNRQEPHKLSFADGFRIGLGIAVWYIPLNYLFYRLVFKFWA